MQALLELRLPLPGDLDFFCAIELDPANRAYTTLNEPLTRELLRQFIASEHNLQKHNQLRQVLVLDTLPIGLLDIYDYDAVRQSAWVGILIHPSFRGNGFGRRGLLELVSFAQKAGIRKLFADTGNERSTALFRRCGFQPEGPHVSFLIH